jgi:methionyl-tRNA formyltransferase
MTPSEVKRTAMEHGIAVDQPHSLRDSAVVKRMQRVEADVLIVAAYGLILPPPVLAVAPLGCINIHASLLPRWRGAAPIQRALLAGDSETGISIMQMDAGLDTGPVLLERRVPIDAEDTAGILEEKLAVAGGDAIVAALEGIERRELIAQPQPAAGVTYAHKITREETRLDWARTAIELERAIRAYNPTPGAYTTHAGQTLKIWRARADATATADDEPGTVIASPGSLAVACGAGILSILELQRAGARRQPAQDFLRGTPIRTGARLGT